MWDRIWINGHLARMTDDCPYGAVESGALDVMKVVMTNDRAPGRPVPSHVEGPDIAGLEAHMVNLVILNEMVVAAQLDGIVRSVVDQVVPDLLTHATMFQAVYPKDRQPSLLVQTFLKELRVLYAHAPESESRSEAGNSAAAE